MSSAARCRGPLDLVAEAVDQWVGDGGRVRGRELHPSLPDRLLGFDEVANLLLRRSVSYPVRDAALRALVRRARADRGWLLALARVLLPGLRRVAARLAVDFPDEVADLDAEVLAGFFDAVDRVDENAPRLAGALLSAAFSAGRRLRTAVLVQVGRRGEMFDSAAPPPVCGHPDLVLADAVRHKVLTASEAQLIGATRLEGVPLADAADGFGLSYLGVHHRRRRAEARLAAWLTGRPVPPRRAV